jgi:hypothetical protein
LAKFDRLFCLSVCLSVCTSVLTMCEYIYAITPRWIFWNNSLSCCCTRLKHTNAPVLQVLWCWTLYNVLPFSLPPS